MSKDNYIMNDDNKAIETTKSEVKVLEWTNGLYYDLNQEIVKVSKQGKNYAEITYVQRKPKQTIKKLSATQYLDLETGEIKDFNLSDKKDNDRSIKATMNRLCGIIRHNFTEGAKNQLFITQTYGENMTDNVKLYIDQKNFIKRLKYAYPDHNFDYISVAEPQGRGAWHFHTLLKSNKKLEIPNDSDTVLKWGLSEDFIKKTVSALWGHGWTKTKKLVSNDVGKYYIHYFTDIKNPNFKVELKQGKKMAKKYVKGGRLSLYPKNFNFYRCSRGIKKPPVYYTTWDEIRKEYVNLDWIKTFDIEQDGEKKNVIVKALLTKKPKKAWGYGQDKKNNLDL